MNFSASCDFSRMKALWRYEGEEEDHKARMAGPCVHHHQVIAEDIAL